MLEIGSWIDYSLIKLTGTRLFDNQVKVKANQINRL